jgi:hypothetical protein
MCVKTTHVPTECHPRMVGPYLGTNGIRSPRTEPFPRSPRSGSCRGVHTIRDPVNDKDGQHHLHERAKQMGFIQEHPTCMLPYVG